MQIVQLSEAQFEQIQNLLREILEKLERPNPPLEGEYIENGDFIRIMKISRRTARDWREQGKLPYTQLGKKIYYPVLEIRNLLKRNYKEANYPFLAIREQKS